MKWFKTAKQKQAEAANLQFEMMKRGSQVFEEFKNEAEPFVMLKDEEDANATVDIWAKTPHDMYAEFARATSDGCDWSAPLSAHISSYISAMVEHTKEINMSEIMSQPICVILHQQAEPIVMPYRVRMIDHGNDRWSFGEVN